MKTLGVIGGLGPEATVEYYHTIITLYRERKPDGSYPQFFINSVDLSKGLALITANDLAGVTKYLLEEIEKLAKAGADFGLIAANTPHIVFDDVQKESSLPLLSIVEATAVAAKARGLKRLGLFGTRFTTQAKFYPAVFSKAGIELVVPDLEDQEYIHDKYLNELVPGKFLPETRENLLAIVDRLRAKIDPPSQSYGAAGIDGVILAGTELPLILREPAHNGVPFLDTTKIHSEAAVTEMLS
ncbi:MAG: aspartate racemase [Verrucomicrobiota bacterium]